MESKLRKISPQGNVLAVYQKCILIICGLTTIMFLLWFIPEKILYGFQLSWIINFKDIAHSLIQILYSILAIIISVHLLAIIVQLIFIKHSIVWIISQQAIPLLSPILLVILLKLFSGQLDEQITEMIVGIFSGIVSSIIILILDRKKLLVDTIMRRIAWEYLDKDESIKKQEEEKKSSH